MKTTEFETQIQNDIDKDLNIRINPNAQDIAGVYWNDLYIGVSVPPHEIHEAESLSYQDAMGMPYKNISLAREFIEAKLEKYKRIMKEDPSLLTDKDD